MSFKNKFVLLIRSQLINASSGMFIANILGGVLGYVYQIVIAQMLSSSDYGLLSAILAIWGIIIVPLASYAMILSRTYAAFYAHLNMVAVTYLYRKSCFQLFVTSLVFIAIFVFAASQLQIYLKSSSLLPILFFGVLVITTIFSTANTALLQGVQNFRWVALNVLIGQSGKLIFGVFFIYLGWAASGALIAIALTMVLTILLNIRIVKTYLQPFNIAKNFEWKDSLGTILPVFIANLAFAIMSQFDMILVKAYFNAEEAGSYAVASVFGKTVMYLPGALVLALYPMVAKNEALERSSFSLLLQSLLITVILSLLGGSFFYLFGDNLIALLYADKYAVAGTLLQFYSFAMVPMAIVMVVEYYLIAKRRVLFAYLMLLAAPLELILIHNFHSTLMQVIWIMGFCGWSLVLVGFFMLLWQNRTFVVNQMKLKLGR
jgi:O-antigen/teichoic acid export membrane protein